ncbi:MAG TPA: hypothetical protein VFU10_04685 [Gaiellaceae bacterium]|nr:hypothetical protein [Gaiellaceae bacterium]
MADDLARAFTFMRRADIRGAHERPFRYGTAVFTPELPLRHDSNYLDVDRPVSPAARIDDPEPRVGLARGRTAAPGRKRTSSATGSRSAAARPSAAT